MSKLKAILIFAMASVVCIGGAALGWPLAGPLVVAAALLGYAFRMPNPVRQLGLVTLVAIIGTGFETGLIAAGLYLPRGMLVESSLCPLWVIGMYVSLGVVAPSFAPVQWQGYIPLAVCGALTAPIVYLLAEVIPGEAIHLTRPLWPTLVLLALLWQGLWPGICWLSQSRWYRERDTEPRNPEPK